MRKSFIILILLCIFSAISVFAQPSFNGTLEADFTDVVAYWSFDSDTTDQSGNGHDATNNGASSTAGIKGNAFDYVDTESDNMQVTDNDAFSFTDGAGNDQPFSISAWVNTDTLASFQSLITKYDAVGSNREYRGFFRDSDNTFGLNLDDGSGGQLQVNAAPAGGLQTGAWYHVVTTYDGSETTGGMQIYINGTNISVSTFTSGAYSGMSNTITDILFGAQFSGAPTKERFLNGRLDEIVIYNIQLNQTEIDDLYQNHTAKEFFQATGPVLENRTFLGGETHTIIINFTSPGDADVIANDTIVSIVTNNVTKQATVTFDPPNTETEYNIEFNISNVNGSSLVETTWNTIQTPIFTEILQNDTHVGGQTLAFTLNWSATNDSLITVNNTIATVITNNGTRTGDVTIPVPNIEQTIPLQFTIQNNEGTQSFDVEYMINAFPTWNEQPENTTLTLGENITLQLNWTGTNDALATANDTQASIITDNTTKQANITFTPTTIGLHIVQYTISNTDGSDTLIANYTVNAAPVIIDPICGDVGEDGRTICTLMAGTGEGLGSIFASLVGDGGFVDLLLSLGILAAIILSLTTIFNGCGSVFKNFGKNT